MIFEDAIQSRFAPYVIRRGSGLILTVQSANDGIPLTNYRLTEIQAAELLKSIAEAFQQIAVENIEDVGNSGAPVEIHPFLS